MHATCAFFRRSLYQVFEAFVIASCYKKKAKKGLPTSVAKLLRRSFAVNRVIRCDSSLSLSLAAGRQAAATALTGVAAYVPVCGCMHVLVCLRACLCMCVCVCAVTL